MIPRTPAHNRRKEFRGKRKAQVGESDHVVTRRSASGGGELKFVVEGPPDSQQSRRSEKEAFSASIRVQMGDCAYLLSGDVKVTIEWTLHEQDRCESDAPSDVDNILKPMLDALGGPGGVLIDDCQVQAVDCRWLDWPMREQRAEIVIRFLAD